MRRFYIENSRGMRVGILNYGGILTNIDIPLNTGGHHNAVLSYPNIEDYRHDTYYLGATIGRYANRIDKGVFRIGHREVQLSVNETHLQNHLHGGFSGFNRKVWNVVTHDHTSITLSYLSEDGEEGYPGNVQATLTYKVEEENTLTIFFHAESDQPTILNLTNHCYFNLRNHSSLVNNHEIQVFASRHTPLNNRHIPVGEEQHVENSVFDLREPNKVGEVMKEIGNANYCITGGGRELTDMARLNCLDSQRSLLIQATYPGLQLYFGNFLKAPFRPYQGICIEPQFYPNSPNQKEFPAPYLGPGEKYQHTIKYSFSSF